MRKFVKKMFVLEREDLCSYIFSSAITKSKPRSSLYKKDCGLVFFILHQGRRP